MATVLARAVAGKAADDFVFVSPTGLPIHHADFYERVWTPLMGAIKAKSVAPFRIHDLRHTHVSWLIACGSGGGSYVRRTVGSGRRGTVGSGVAMWCRSAVMPGWRVTFPAPGHVLRKMSASVWATGVLGVRRQ